MIGASLSPRPPQHAAQIRNKIVQPDGSKGHCHVHGDQGLLDFDLCTLLGCLFLRTILLVFRVVAALVISDDPRPHRRRRRRVTITVPHLCRAVAATAHCCRLRALAPRVLPRRVPSHRTAAASPSPPPRRALRRCRAVAVTVASPRVAIASPLVSSRAAAASCCAIAIIVPSPTLRLRSCPVAACLEPHTLRASHPPTLHRPPLPSVPYINPCLPFPPHTSQPPRAPTVAVPVRPPFYRRRARRGQAIPELLLVKDSIYKI
uniref:Uncharacterized protein n=1 Tax=Oryza nivara TaxID=4536 RepID=A0A0E0INQ8_ORYNI